MSSPAAKVAVSGAFSTGKTTLDRALAKHLTMRGVTTAIVEDVARDAPVSLHLEQTASASAWLIGTQMARESETAEGDVDLVLCDRAIFDVLSHTLLIEPGSERDRRLIHGLWQAGAAWADTYDVILTTAIDRSIPPQADGLRVAEEGYRDRLDRSLDEVFTRLGLSKDDLPVIPAETLNAALASLREAGIARPG